MFCRNIFDDENSKISTKDLKFMPFDTIIVLYIYVNSKISVLQFTYISEEEFDMKVFRAGLRRIQLPVKTSPL